MIRKGYNIIGARNTKKSLLPPLSQKMEHDRQYEQKNPADIGKYIRTVLQEWACRKCPSTKQAKQKAQLLHKNTAEGDFHITFGGVRYYLCCIITSQKQSACGIGIFPFRCAYSTITEYIPKNIP